MEYPFKLHKLCQTKAQRWFFVVGVVVAVTHLLFQSLLFPYGNALRSLLPSRDVPMHIKPQTLTVQSSIKSLMVRNHLTVNASDFIDASMVLELDEDAKSFNVEGNNELDIKLKGKDRYKETTATLGEKDHHNGSEVVVGSTIEDVHIGKNVSFVSTSHQGVDSTFDLRNKDRQGFPKEQTVRPNMDIFIENALEETISLSEKESDGGLDNPLQPETLASAAASSFNATASMILTSGNHPVVMTSPVKKKKSEMPPKSVTLIYEMNRILVRRRRSSRSMRPRWSSIRDQEILAVKAQIEHASPAINDQELYAPLFRNVSMFKRSYELMEHTLKVYVYKDGSKPIFHQPVMKGLYASEGWFMKLMEGNKQYVTKDPRRAHLFYMPFSSRMLEYTLYVRNSHNRTNLRQYLKEYTEKIAAKYRFWNRTGGADHFLVACHDWAPYETRHHMEHCIKALCNADVTAGFVIGRDVSLPETYVRSARNPLKDLGGKPPSQRHILAFYAGNMHGYLRTILIKHWKDKDPDMKIFGPMPPGVASKMNYIQHMKSSKYCICPKGYEVNSPRVVEAIFYECVPVIISDNFVPPFFEVLDWGSFSIILAEKDIPNLKDILVSIPDKKYLEMQLGVRKVQKHFLWHAKPLKYDLFHMTLHSIWYNRVFQIKAR